MEYIPEELEIPEEWEDEFMGWGDFELDEGSSGESPNSYYIYVPEHADKEFLEEMDWKVGDCIRVSLNAFDDADPDNY